MGKYQTGQGVRSKGNKPEHYCMKVGISPECACGPSEWGKLQAILRPEYQLKIYPQEINGPILFTGA